MARTKKLTAKELDEQIGYGKEIDTKSIVAEMKKGIKKVRKAVSEATPATKSVVATKTAKKVLPPADKLAELGRKRAEKLKNNIEDQIDIRVCKITKVHIEPARDGEGLEVWKAYLKEGHIRTIWEATKVKDYEEAIKVAKKLIPLIGKEVKQMEALRA